MHVPSGSWSLLSSFLLPPFASILLSTGCGDGTPPGDVGYTLRDSAGIIIVENGRPAWAEGEGWRFSSDPRLTIGVADGPDEYNLFRASKAMRMADGRILVTNSGTQELRFYDPQGTFLASSGREGEGPGEFRSLGYTWRTETDSLLAYDFRLRRFSVFDGGGAFVRSFLLDAGENVFAFPDGVFGDGTVLASVDEQDQGDYSELGTVRGRKRFGRFGRDGKLIGFQASLPGSELYKGTHPDGSGFTTAADHAVRPYATAGTSSWFYGSGDSYEFQEWGRGGELLKLIRLARERRGMPEEIRTARDERLREMNPQAAALWRRVPLPDSLPTHEDLLVDGEGNLWVLGYVVREQEPYWSVIDTTGRWLGNLTPPAGFRISEIGADYVTGIWADTLGVQQVRVYGLEKDGGPAG